MFTYSLSFRKLFLIRDSANYWNNVTSDSALKANYRLSRLYSSCKLFAVFWCYLYITSGTTFFFQQKEQNWCYETPYSSIPRLYYSTPRFHISALFSLESKYFSLQICYNHFFFNTFKRKNKYFSTLLLAQILQREILRGKNAFPHYI